MNHFAAADYAAAFTDLRAAAFGLIEKVEQFEMAQSYACIAAHRLGRDSDARDSLMRIVGAEKMQPRYRSIELPDSLRAELNAIAANLLTSQEVSILGIIAAAKPVVDVPAPAKQPDVGVTAGRDGGPDGRPRADDPKPMQQPVTAVPVPVPVPVPMPAPQPEPKKPISQQAPTEQVKAPVAVPRRVAPAPQPAPTPQPPTGNRDGRLADAQRAVEGGDIDRARSLYKELSTATSLSHEAALRVAEGLYHVHDFAGATRIFARAGAIGQGEEGYHYYYAVALYETGRYGDAKREFAAALPYITVTPDVTRYRAKIEGAIE